jgi:hypothetical protein
MKPKKLLVRIRNYAEMNRFPNTAIRINYFIYFPCFCDSEKFFCFLVEILKLNLDSKGIISYSHPLITYLFKAVHCLDLPPF